MKPNNTKPRRKTLNYKAPTIKFNSSKKSTKNLKSRPFHKISQSSLQNNVYSRDSDDDSDDDISSSKSLKNAKKYDQFENLDYKLGEIKFEDDEEIDEDEAFDDEDEAKYGHFFEKRGGDGDGELSEEDEDEDDDDEDDEEGLDLSEMLKDSQPQKSHSGKLTKIAKQLLPEDDDDDEMNSENEELEEIDDDDEELDEEYDESKMAAFISNLDKEKSTKPKKLQSKSESFPESEFNISTTTDTNTAHLNLSDLVSTLPSSDFSSLKKEISQFTSKPATPAPLPERLQEKIEREQAFKESKKEVSKWAPVVKANREADKLEFAVGKNEMVSSGMLVSKFTPGTEMEKEIFGVLKDGVSEKKELEREGLEMQKISKEELIKRRAELAKLRSLLFFQEQKQKKISKIKSKTYRKMRKDKGGDSMDLAELEKLDPEEAERERLKLETARAQERMTLKHKSTGKWAREMKNKHEFDDQTRFAMMEQLEKHEKLTKRIRGRDSDDSDDSDMDPTHSDAENENDDEASVQQKSLAKLDAIISDINSESTPSKGVFGMKFMQRDFEKQKSEVLRKIQDTKEKIESGDLDGLGKSDDEEVEESHSDGFDDDDYENGEKAAKKKAKLTENGTKTDSVRMTFSGVRDTEAGLDSDDDMDDDESIPIGESSSAEFGVKMSGRLSIPKPAATSISKLPATKPLFQVESFELETEFVGDLNVTKVDNIALPNLTLPDAKETTDSELLETTEPEGDKKAKRQRNRRNLKDTNEKVSDEETKEWNINTLGTENPWLTSTTQSIKSLKQTGSASSKTEKSLSKMSQDKRKLRTGEEEGVLVDLSSLKKLESAPTKPFPQDEKNMVVPQVDTSDDEDAEFTPEQMTHSSDIKKLSRRQVMQLAFASDNVVEEFEEEKDMLVDEEVGEDKEVQLPGWGKWAGAGVKPTKADKRAEERKVQARKEKLKNAKEARKDANLQHVIISEKRIKKATKYMISKVPHNFDNRDQYERTMKGAVGVEWNTMNQYQENITPKVSTKSGIVIHPMKVGEISALRKRKR